MASTNMRWASVSFGKANFSSASHTVAVLAVSAPFKRETVLNAGRAEHSSKEYFQSSRFRDQGGGFTRQRVSLPEGTLVALQATRTTRGLVTAEATIFLRIREGADQLIINSLVPAAPESFLGDAIQSFSGAADILTADELSVLGIRVPGGYARRYCEPEEIRELFEVQVVRKGNMSKPQLVAMATSEGVVVRAVGSEGQRRIKIRRP